MDMLALITFILGMILGSTMIVTATYVYLKKQLFPTGAIVMTVFGTLLLGLSIWKTASVQIGADGNIKASFEKLTKEVKEEVKQSNQSVTEKINDLKNNINLDSSTLGKLRSREIVDKKVESGDYEGAIKLDPTNVIPYMRLIEQLVKNGDYENAVSYYQPMAKANESGVGYSVYPDLIFAYDQSSKPNEAISLINQLRIRINIDISKGYGYYSRSQQIRWLKDNLQTYNSLFKNDNVKKANTGLITELNTVISKLTQ